jgi:hypothetical protein
MLESIVSTLPATWQPYAKTYAAALVSALTAIAALTPLPEWVTIVVAVLTAPLVFGTPNLVPAARKQDESVQPPVQYASDTKLDAALHNPQAGE